MNIQEIADLLTEDPDIMCEAEGPRVRNLGTALRGMVATQGKKYGNALEKAVSGGTDVKKLVKEVQSAIVNGAKLLANDPEELETFLKTLKQTINSDLVKIAAYYRKQQDKQEQGQEDLRGQEDLQGQEEQL